MQIVDAAMQLAHARKTESHASPQLRQASNQFEASFLQELLKPMTQDSMFGSSGSLGTVGSVATQALADGIARDGGLGIAKRVLADLAPVEAAQSGKAAATSGTKCGECAVQLPSMEGSSDQAAAVPPISNPALPAALENHPLPLQHVEKLNPLHLEKHSSYPAAGR